MEGEIAVREKKREREREREREEKYKEGNVKKKLFRSVET